MILRILHTTQYRYAHFASEACVEARLIPPALPWQQTLMQEIVVEPEALSTEFDDAWGNRTIFFSLAQRHELLNVENRLQVRTRSRPLPAEIIEISVAEARQIYNSQLADVFDYLQPSLAVPLGGKATEWARKIFPGRASLGPAIQELTARIHAHFAYRPGATNISTPLDQIWKKKAGVCQDFAHIALSVLRTAGIPSRYVCGYVDAGGPAALVGSLATHAWIEALLPGGQWVATDPTNNTWCGERHVTIAYGRDFDDAAPVRGTFKGSGEQKLRVRVRVSATPEKL